MRDVYAGDQFMKPGGGKWVFHGKFNVHNGDPIFRAYQKDFEESFLPGTLTRLEWPWKDSP
jgi:hypothetical protein